VVCHPIRVQHALVLVFPKPTSFVVVETFGVFAEATGFGAILMHPSRILLTLLQHRPSWASVIEVDTDFVTSSAADGTIEGHPSTIAAALALGGSGGALAIKIVTCIVLANVAGSFTID